MPSRTPVPVPVLILALVLVLGVGVAVFLAATTFIGDDHLFLYFARHVPDPLVAFVRDQHGGEFYRPLPMVIWWLLAHLGGGSKAPFAALAFTLHLVVSFEVGALVTAVGGGVGSRDALRAGGVAALLFILSPATQEAAFWYAASTDLFATALGLGAVLAVMHDRRWIASSLLAAACCSKESALIVPALAAVAVAARVPHPGPPGSPKRTTTLARRIGGSLLAFVPVVSIYVLVRTAVLRGPGGAADAPAPLLGKLVQIGSGLGHAVSGSVLSSDSFSWALTLVAAAALWWKGSRGGARLGRRSPGVAIPGGAAPLAWVALAVMPLLAAPWIVGARYFYLPAVGLAWLAAEVLVTARAPVLVGVIALLAGLDAAQLASRVAEVRDYEHRLSAARRAVADGLAHGYTTFHVAGGIKDLDLAIKNDPRLDHAPSDLLVLGDVPASFVAVPDGRLAGLDFLLARPPIPPAGAYRFGDHRVVGLARRGDDPTLDEVLARFPAMRFIRLRAGPAGKAIYRDITETMTRDPSGAPEDRNLNE